MKNLTKEVTIKANYKKFDLASWVKEKSLYIKLLRDYCRSGNEDFLNQLIRAGAILGVQEKHNLVPTVGRNVLARLLAGDATYSGEVDYGALGNGSATFTNASTILDNEVYRKQAASQAFDDNIAFIDWFIASGDVADQTFTEFGAFIDGTASADTGQAFSLVSGISWVKSGSIFVSAQYSLT